MARSRASLTIAFRKTCAAFFVAVFTLALTVDLRAGSLAGVTLPDTAQVGSTTLALNGMGLRTKIIVKVYVVGLYLPQKSSDAAGIMKADEPKRIVMQFVHSASKSQMADAFNESFASNSPDAVKTMKADIDRLTAALEPVKPGDQMVFTYLPGKGTTFALNGSDKVTIANPAFGPVLFSVWLGPKPPNADLKKGILGQ
jgi:Chalcone isomerase-like